MNWVMEHMGDEDFADPFIPPSQSRSTNQTATAFTPNPEGLQLLMAMGFTEAQATKALKQTVCT